MNSIQQQQEKALETLKDLSKWIVSLNFGAATGCVFMLQQGVSSIVKFYLIAAVFFFFLSIVISNLLLLLLPIVIQKLPLKTRSKQSTIYDYSIYSNIALKHLVATQFIFFAVGLVSLFTWILLKK